MSAPQPTPNAMFSSCEEFLAGGLSPYTYAITPDIKCAAPTRAATAASPLSSRTLPATTSAPPVREFCASRQRIAGRASLWGSMERLGGMMFAIAVFATQKYTRKEKERFLLMLRRLMGVLERVPGQGITRAEDLEDAVWRRMYPDVLEDGQFGSELQWIYLYDGQLREHFEDVIQFVSFVSTFLHHNGDDQQSIRSMCPLEAIDRDYHPFVESEEATETATEEAR